MKSIDLSTSSPTLAEVLELAASGEVVVRTPEGRAFAVVELDDFADEVAAARQNPELMRLLAERSKEPGRHTLDEVRAQLGGG